MKYLIATVWFLGIFHNAWSQSAVRGLAIDGETGEPIVGVNIVVVGGPRGATTDREGKFEFRNIHGDTIVLQFRHISYEHYEIEVTLPLEEQLLIRLEPILHESEEITITTTRSSRTIDDTPTRVEAITEEELDEKATMRSVDIRMQLNESTGIQVQQTSAASGNSTFRIQGLDGRYTQLLRDGFPLYSEFSSGLSIMQIPPLDLRQIEVVKGSASTLYGGGAIAGIINLVSREPADKPMTSFMLNGTTAGGIDVNAFHAAQRGTVGWTLFGSATTQSPYDANDDDFSDIPEIRRWTLSPKIFWTPGITKLIAGTSVTLEQRRGGDMQVIKNEAHGDHMYFEKNNSSRFSTQLMLSRPLGTGTITGRNSFSRFDRRIRVPGHGFDGIQVSTFSEVSYHVRAGQTEWIFGSSYVTEDFDERSSSSTAGLDQTAWVAGTFVQSTLRLSNKVQTENGLRVDKTKDHGLFILPRTNFLITWSQHLTNRFGGGMGYKIPSIFNEQSEQAAFRNLRPISPGVKAERSIGGNADFNYRGVVRPISFSFNQLFYYTRLDDPVAFDEDSAAVEVLVVRNKPGYIDSRGFETNARISLDEWKFFLGYTFLDARHRRGPSDPFLPLVARHRLGMVLMYELEGSARAGFEAYYTGRQRREDLSRTRPFWVMGFMAEKKWRNFRFYANFENLLDTRQSRFENMVGGTLQNPSFREIYAPVEGFVINAGVKMTL